MREFFAFRANIRVKIPESMPDGHSFPFLFLLNVILKVWGLAPKPREIRPIGLPFRFFTHKMDAYLHKCVLLCPIGPVLAYFGVTYGPIGPILACVLRFSFKIKVKLHILVECGPVKWI